LVKIEAKAKTEPNHSKLWWRRTGAFNENIGQTWKACRLGVGSRGGALARLGNSVGLKVNRPGTQTSYNKKDR